MKGVGSLWSLQGHGEPTAEATILFNQEGRRVEWNRSSPTQKEELMKQWRTEAARATAMAVVRELVAGRGAQPAPRQAGEGDIVTNGSLIVL